RIICIYLTLWVVGLAIMMLEGTTKIIVSPEKLQIRSMRAVWLIFCQNKRCVASMIWHRQSCDYVTIDLGFEDVDSENAQNNSHIRKLSDVRSS
ncbi:hypothetical protein NPIL_161121, partial [Nephila pilipes]